MKILRVISSMDPAHGGPSQGIRQSVPALQELGVISEVVTLDDPGADFFVKDTFKIHALGKPRNRWYYHHKLMPWLMNNLQRFDIVIVHGIWQFPSYAVRKAMQKMLQPAPGARRPKIFVMPHGMLDPWFQHHPPRRLKSIRNRIYWNFIESQNIRAADGVLFTCQAELELARGTFRHYSPAAEINVGYGIGEPPAVHSQTNIIQEIIPGLGGKPFILFLGRLDRKKGADLLIKSYIRLLREGRELPALMVAGPASDHSFAAELHRMTAGIGVIHFPGMLTGEKKWAALYTCEAFILPSHQENFSISVVEALACGKPVLISNKINIYKEIAGEHAAMVGDDSEDGTAKIISDWLQMPPASRENMGRNARRCYEKYFTARIAANRMIEKLNG